MSEVTPEIAPESMFLGGGEVGALMQADGKEAFGPIASWPALLKTVASICLSSHFPMVVWWGDDFRLLYNDAFIPVLGDRHPKALGQPAQAVFAESWHIIGPQLQGTFKTKTASREENLRIPALRFGYLEESYYTYSYSPLLTKKGEVKGVFTVINETTKQVLSERRLATSSRLAQQSEAQLEMQPEGSQTIEEVYQSIIKTLSANPADIPFIALYRLNPAKTQALLCGRSQLDAGAILFPPVMSFDGDQDPWQFESVLHSRRSRLLEDLPARFGTSPSNLPKGMFDLPVTRARVMPLYATGLKSIWGLLVVGINPARQISADYASFLDLIASHVASRVNSAIARADSQRTQQALKISEERFKSFVESDVVGILFGNIDGSINEVNNEFLRIVGYSREDVRLGKLRWTHITPPEYFPADEEGIAEAQQSGACTPYEKEYIRKDGTRVAVLIGYALLGENKEKSAAFILDVSDRKKIQESLQRREMELQTVTDTVPMLISVVDADQRYRFNNKRYEEWFGQSASTLYGRRLDEVMSEKTYRRLLPYIQQVLTGQTVTFEDEFMLKDTMRYTSVTFVPQFDAAGAVDGFVSTISDVSDRKQAETEREALLQREYAAREAAERANRIKDEFLAVVSHELRTPMNPILGWSQLLKRGNLSPQKVAQAMETIERNARSQVQLIDDLLDISRVLRGKMNLAQQPIDLSEIIAAALENVHLAAESKSLRIEQTLVPARVNGDEGRLQQVMWNLLSNAVKFTPEGGQITVSLRPENGTAHIQVADTGKGIAAAFLPYVFEHFRQEDYSTTRQFGGLGLGLAIVRQIVELHGGRVAVTSAGVDQGATFTVQIPLAKQRVDEPLTAQSSPVDNDLSNLHILVVDDEADSQEITAFALEQAGAKVAIASNGADALAVIAQRLPDVIVSDIGMPEMDGYVLMQRIRSLPADSGGKVLAIALTAYAGEIDLKRAAQAGFQRHVAKPIDPEKLVAIVASMVGSHLTRNSPQSSKNGL
ncbi:MAG: PAS domain S-box protein [Phormidesmis sp.]